MRKFIFGTSILFSLSLPAQLSRSFNPEFRSTNLHLESVDKSKYLQNSKDGRGLEFGYVPFDAAKLNGYLDSSSVHGSFKDYYMGIGGVNVSNNSKHYDAITSFLFILPQKVNAGPGDSLQLRMGGWHYTTSIFGFDVVSGETVTLAIAPCVTWGNLKMRRMDHGQKTKYTNPFVAPGGRVELRFKIGNFIIGGRATYRYDITHGLWKRKDNLMPVLPEYKNTGLAYSAYIGLML